MRNTDNEYWEIWKGAIGALILLAIFIMFFLSGCKTVKNLKKSTQDSVAVNKTNEVTSKTDSSGTKSDKTNTKETVYYPQPIYIEGKNGETKVVFVPQSVKETGTEKTEQFQVVKDESWRSAIDSIKVSILALSQDKKTKVGFSTFEIIVICALGFLFIKSFLPSIKNLITKT